MDTVQLSGNCSAGGGDPSPPHALIKIGSLVLGSFMPGDRVCLRHTQFWQICPLESFFVSFVFIYLRKVDSIFFFSLS